MSIGPRRNGLKRAASETRRRDQRQCARLDRRLQVVPLSLGQLPRAYLGVDLILFGLLERIGERGRRHAELVRRVGNDRGALRTWRVELRGRNRATRPADDKQSNNTTGDLVRAPHPTRDDGRRS